MKWKYPDIKTLTLAEARDLMIISNSEFEQLSMPIVIVFLPTQECTKDHFDMFQILERPYRHVPNSSIPSLQADIK